MAGRLRHDDEVTSRRAEIDGRMRIIRATDGIHMTAHGATMVSREVIALLEARVDSTKL